MLRHFKGNNTRDQHKILRELAEIEPVKHPDGTLEKLIQNLSSSLPRGMEVLLLASREAAVASAIRQIRSISTEVQCHALAFDIAKPTVSNETAGMAAEDHSFSRRSPTRYRQELRQAVQIIAGKDALAQALESHP